MSTLHKEINFETEICEYLASHGWHYSPDDSGYDRVLARYPADLEAWDRAGNAQSSADDVQSSLDKALRR